VGDVLDFLSTSFAIELDPRLPNRGEFVLVTVIRISWQAISTFDVEIEITRITIVKEKVIVRCTTSITTFITLPPEKKGMVWVQRVIYLPR
jgi:hypothetical protein